MVSEKRLKTTEINVEGNVQNGVSPIGFYQPNNT